MAALDRIEGLLKVLMNGHIQFARKHKRLLKAQVILTDRMDRLSASLNKLAQVQLHSDERIKKLIGMVAPHRAETEP